MLRKWRLPMMINSLIVCVFSAPGFDRCVELVGSCDWWLSSCLCCAVFGVAESVFAVSFAEGLFRAS